MKSYAMRKLSASFVVLVMALSALVVVLPSVNSGQSSSGVNINIYVPVISGGVPVTGAVVNLTDVHTGQVTAATYSAARASYVATNPDPGYYRVDVTAANYFNPSSATFVYFTGLKNVTVNPVSLTPFPTKDRYYTVTVMAPGVGLVTGALVGFYNTSNRQFVSSAMSNSTGVAVLTMYRTTLATDVSLVVIYAGFETYSLATIVNTNQTPTITLVPSKKVSGFVQDSDGNPAQNVVAYLINTDPSVVWVKRVLRATGSSFSFDAYPGTFTLVVDAPGNNANVTTVVVPGSGSVPTLNIALDQQTQRVEHVDMAFLAGDFSQFSLSVSTEWSFDDAYPGLMYNDMGSLRAQIDLVMGDGNGYLSTTEIDSFNSMLETYGAQYVTSTDLLTVNHTWFANATITNFNDSLMPGPVTSTAGVNYSYDCQYTAHGTIPVGGSSYNLNATANLNSPNVDYKYSVSLAPGYELVQNTTPPGVVLGYETVTYDSNATGTGSYVIQLTVEKSTRPIAVGRVSLPSQNASSVLNRTGALLRYIVGMNKNVTFDAKNSSDPNGNPLTYIWDFNDSTPLVTTMNSSVVHKFTTSFALKNVTLTVRDVAGLENYTFINVTSDGMLPTPVIRAKAGNELAVGNAIAVNQSELVTFNSTYSYDDAVTANDHLGVIDHFAFDYGDKNVSGPITWSNPQKNVTHAYPNAGQYIVVLNVTDVTGQYKNTTLTVNVNDTSSPTVKFTYRNSTYGTSIVENQTVHFDANATRDNVDNYTNMSYSWSFGDTHWLNGTGLFNVTHTYSKIGSFTVTLKVTDKANNNGTSTIVMNVASGPRPNLIISTVYFDPTNFTQGSTGYIMVNITNSGNAVATNVLIQFYIVPDNGGPLVKIGETSNMLNGTTSVTTILPGGKVQIKFPYSPSGTGTLTIRVNVTSANQLTPGTYLCSGNQALHVKEAAYKALLLWIGVAVIVVAIPSLLFVWNRMRKREKKGPRRERKESKEKESKEEEEL